ncbi:serine/threonine protein kinase [Nocardia panacis]|uniref:Serine/threonine protein kinase n=1 Tax=Nocardia panacis TaxID=2340916 RepID=A0A3A4K391_9NOCA|nr:serine/threonine-protein kinase [Nocardia panacis]RJO70974.1 serine/threonine protein kinase [Nocardia panacis]
MTRHAGPDAGAAEAVAGFTAAWRDAVDPPNLDDFLPIAAGPRRAALVELVKIDLAQRWSRDIHPKRLADYVRELPELADHPLPPDLVYEEFRLRRQAGGDVRAADYTAAYPAQAEQFTEMLADDELPRPPEEPVPLDDLGPGQTVDDFDLMTGLGRGAFARVFLARQRSMQRLVAVKISADKGTEPQTLAQLDHDYIVRVFDQRIMPKRRLRLLYMQYIPGGTLFSVLDKVRHTEPAERCGATLLDAIDSVLGEKGEIRPGESPVRGEIATLTWPETVAWLGRRLAIALDHAGHCGVLHRDIKPANVLLTAEGIPKLADFNISFSGNVTGDSPVAYFGGSLAYMSPEQLAVIHPELPTKAADLDTRSDLYALAVVLWELLTGTKPFGEDTVAGSDRAALDAMLKRRTGDPRTLLVHHLPPDCPPALRRALMRALDPNPDQRWSSGADFAQQLDICLDERARDLVDPPAHSWRRWAAPYLHVAGALAIAVPNLLAILYSSNHSRRLIIDKLDTAAQQHFTTAVNASFIATFVFGYVVINALTLRAWFTLMGLRRGRTYDSTRLAHVRADTLRFTMRCELICAVLWGVGGLVVPVAVELSGNSVPADAHVHFFLNQIICGGIALAYPYFLISYFSIRAVYPIFIPHGGLDRTDDRQLCELGRNSIWFLGLAASIPLLGMAAATFIPAADLPRVVVPLRVLGVGSALGFLLCYWLYRQLEGDIAALRRIVHR